MVLAELAGGIAHGLKHRSNGWCLIRHSERCARLPDRGEAGADRQFTSNEVRATRRAARLCVIVGKAHPFRRQSVQVGRSTGHDALVVRASVAPTDIISHDENDVGFFLRCSQRLACGHERNRGYQQG
jgi:hypothetical protein